MRLKFDKPTLKWAFVKGTRAEVWGTRISKGMEAPGETISRVLVTVTRVPAKRGKHG